MAAYIKRYTEIFLSFTAVFFHSFSFRFITSLSNAALLYECGPISWNFSRFNTPAHNSYLFSAIVGIFSSGVPYRSFYSCANSTWAFSRFEIEISKITLNVFSIYNMLYINSWLKISHNIRKTLSCLWRKATYTKSYYCIFHYWGEIDVRLIPLRQFSDRIVSLIEFCGVWLWNKIRAIRSVGCK